MTLSKILFLLAYLVISCSIHVKCQISPSSKLEYFHKVDSVLNNPEIYDKRIQPPVTEEGTNVQIQLFISDLWDLNQKQMDCEMDCYLTLMWKDSRLIFDINQTIFYTSSESIKKLWIPSIYYPNVKVASFHNVPQPNQLLGIELFTGNVIYGYRASITFSCPLYFQAFPFDSQECSLFIAALPSEIDVTLLWTEGKPLTFTDDINLPQFKLVDFTTNHCTRRDLSSSCIEATLYFQRRIEFHLINTYVPSALLVIISWSSFWMDPSAIPGRVSLGITNLLAISTKAAALLSSTVEVSYVKAIDVWMIVCTAFIFLSMCEFVAANYKWQLNKEKLSSCTSEEKDVLEEGQRRRAAFCNFLQRYSIDEWSRIIFPGAFIIFNAVYWSYYLS